MRRLIYEEVLEFHPLERDRYHELRSVEARTAELHRQQAAAGVAPGAAHYDYGRMVR